MTGAAAAFAGTWRNRDLRRAQFGFAGAWTAEWAFTVAVGVYAFRQGGTTAVGIVALLRMLPAALLTPVVTPYADRWRRDRVLTAVSAVRAVASALAVIVVAADGSPLLVYALVVMAAVAAVLYRPVHSALLPSLCTTPVELASANVVRGTLDSAAMLVGPAAAAVLLHASGVAAVFGLISAASAWSAWLTWRVAAAPAPPIVRSADPVRAVAQTLAGIRAVHASRELRVLIGLAAVQTVVRGSLAVFSVVVAIDLLHIGESGVGTLNAALGAGALVGSVTTSLLIGTRRLARWFGIGVALWSLPLVLLGLAPAEPTALAVLAVAGTGNALVDLGVFTLIARLAPDAVLARVFGVLESAVALGVAVGAVAAPATIALVGLRLALLTFGVLGPALVAVCWWRLTVIDNGIGARDRLVDLLHEVRLLGPLPLPTVELLALSLEPVAVPAGTDVFRQGDPGDRYYVIEVGNAEVVGDGHRIAALGPGEGFGEVALLRQVPRTATVRATTDLELEALSGERFVAVVTGFRPSSDLAAAHVGSLLTRFAPDAAPVPGQTSEG